MAQLGPPMSLTDATYTSSEAYRAGASGMGSGCDCPGFDLLQSTDALLGRWVRSPSKFVGWDTYMEFFGLAGDKALQETEEPQEHVILAFSKAEMRILHRLPWRDGLDCEYTVPIDGSSQPIPPAMVARASSSWKVNDLMSWVHAWDEGDGNPLHRGLRTEQKLTIGGTDYALRYWRNLIRPREIRVNVEVTYADTGKYAVHTQRFFHKIEVDPSYSIAAAPSLSGFNQISTWTHNGHAVRLVVLPHAVNMPKGWADLATTKQLEHAEPFPSAGRSTGPFLSAVRASARDAALWVVTGVVLRTDQGLVRGVALIGADGWLHGVYTDASASIPFVAGSGDWPATQRERAHGVYDTELGRVAMCASPPDAATLTKLVEMGAELVVSPTNTAKGRVSVSLQLVQTPHAHSSKYAICGPEPVPNSSCSCRERTVVVVAEKEGTLNTSQLPIQLPLQQ